MSSPRLSIAVCTWNHSRLLRDCLSSLVDQESDAPFEILVIDDGSTDDSAGVVDDLATRSAVPVRYLRQEHAGLNAARNFAVRAAAGEVIHFFDDDQLAPPGHVSRLLAWFANEPSVDGVGGPCRDYGGGLRTCPDCTLAAVDVPGEGVRESQRLLGGNMAIPARVFLSVGAFDQRLSGRGDENEWFARAGGRRFVQDPSLWVWHRRDRERLWQLCRRGFRQGRSRPLAAEQQGEKYQVRIGRLLRYIGHAFRHRCAKGLELAARDLGSAYSVLKNGSHRRTERTVE